MTGLATEPHRNGVAAVTGSPFPSTPQARRWSGPSGPTTAYASPGVPVAAMRSRT